MSHTNKKADFLRKTSEALESISKDRARTNLLKKYEQWTIAFFVQRIPSWVSSNMLTAFGFFGNMIVFLCFILATYVNRNYLLLGFLGFAISWFGDSMDGRVAYYRKTPRKWFGFSLDITIDWLSILLIGCGFIVYAEEVWELLGYAFVLLYGWEMIIALMRYKITGKYSIDSGKIGPTEVRIVISAILVLEVIFKGSLNYSALIIVIVMLMVNIIDTRKLFKVADEMDIEEAKKKLLEQ
jgi:phosphatidylglycerophosphate synthase